MAIILPLKKKKPAQVGRAANNNAQVPPQTKQRKPAQAEQPAKPKKAKKKWTVQRSAMSICEIITGDKAAGRVLHDILYEYLHSAKVWRAHEKQNTGFLFYSGNDLALMTNTNRKTLQNRAIPALKKCGFMLVLSGKISKDQPKEYRIQIDQPKLYGVVARALWGDTVLGMTPSEFTARMEAPKAHYILRRLGQQVCMAAADHLGPNYEEDLKKIPEDERQEKYLEMLAATPPAKAAFKAAQEAKTV